jgi:predicted alpha-1,6-mannanase (GH76 family)
MMRRSTFRIRDPLASATEAKRIANAAINHLTVRGVLTEQCSDNGCGTAAQSFKGIFVRDLTMMAVIAKTTAKDTNSHHQLGVFWVGPIADRTSWSQASALDALVASLKLP